MRLSMWILFDWLSEYHPIPQIQEGGRILRNARLFSDDLVLSRSTVYLSQIDEKTIMCANGHDILILQAGDIIEVQNKILDAFDYYNECMSLLYDRINEGCDEKTLLEAGCELLRRHCIIADATFFVREHAGSIENYPEKEWINSIYNNRILSTEHVLQINRMSEIRKPDVPAYLVDIPNHTNPLVTNLFRGGEHQGWLITIKENSNYTMGERNLQDAFTEILNLWLEKHQIRQEYRDKAAVLLELLQDEDMEPQILNERMAGFNWYQDDWKYLYVIRQVDTTKNPGHVMERFLERLSSDAFVIRYDGLLIYIINETLLPDHRFEQDFAELMERCGCIAGKSPAFQDIRKLRQYYQAARIAVDSASETGGTIQNFDDVKISYMISVLENHSAVPIRHPAVGILQEYDKKHETTLGTTLYVFLQTACNYTKTARILHIHRTTLQYRIEKLVDMTGIDLEDCDTRFLLLYTFLAEK